MTTRADTDVGPSLRRWREHRRVSQQALALDADVSARHLSFVENGRSRPGRPMLVRVLERLEVPLRERNRILVSAGHAPAYPERSLDDPDLGQVREALDAILTGHEPYPAVAVDRAWNMVAANRPMFALSSQVDIDPDLLEPPVNILRLGLHPRGLGPLYTNLGDWHGHWVRRLQRQLAATGDEQIAALLDEIETYPVPEAAQTSGADMLGPVKVRARDGSELAFFGMFAGFDTPFEVTTSELAVELLFPADRETAERMEAGDALTLTDPDSPAEAGPG